jgi:hypothetical protein
VMILSSSISIFPKIRESAFMVFLLRSAFL